MRFCHEVFFLLIKAYLLLHSFYTFKTKYLLTVNHLRIGIFNSAKLLNNPLACCSLINLNFLLLHNAHLDESIILSFLVFTTFGFLLSVFFQTSKYTIILFYI